jgi:hypothetical protein
MLVMSVLLIYPETLAIQDTGHRTQNTEHRTQDTGHRTQNTGHRAQDTEHRTQDTGQRQTKQEKLLNNMWLMRFLEHF